MSGHKLRIVDGRPGRFWVDDALIDAPIRFYSKLVYCTLARLVRGTKIKISRLDLARLADLSISSIKRALTELEETGWIEIIQSAGMKVENTYRLLGRPVPTVQPEPSTVQPGPSHGPARTATTTTEATKAEEARSKAEVQQSQKQHPAPNSGAAKSAAQAQDVQVDGLLTGAVVVDAGLEAPPVPRPRPAGGTHAAAAAPGPPDPAAPVATAPISPAAAAPGLRGHPAVALYCDRWTVHHGGTSPTITPKRVGILTRIYKKLGAAADAEYPKLLDTLFDSRDAFIVSNAHSPETFETKLDALRVNGHGPAMGNRGLARAGRESIDEKWEGQPVGAVTL